MEFAQLAKVANMIDGRDSYNEPLKLGKHLSINLDSALRREVSEFNSSPEAFARAVRVLMLWYVLASSADVGNPWRSSGAAQQHISTVGNLSRISARSGQYNRNKILDAEMNVRFERARIAQAETIFFLGRRRRNCGAKFYDSASID